MASADDHRIVASHACARVEERLNDARPGALAAMFDRDLDLEPGTRCGPFRLQVRERDVLLQERRPAAARRAPPVRPGRSAHSCATPWLAGAWRPTSAYKRSSDCHSISTPTNCHCGPRAARRRAPRARRSAPSGDSRSTRDRARMDSRSAVDQRLARRHVIDVDQHQPRFDASHVEREHPGRHNP